MTAVILTVHTLLVLGLIGVVLLQRSEGGALGMGGAGSGGGFMTGRGAANALTRTTSILAALFFATSLGLAILAGQGESETDVIEELTGEVTTEPTEGPAAPAAPTAEELLQTLGGDDDATDFDSISAETPSGGAPVEDGSAPLTEQEILDALGTEPAEEEDPNQ